MNKREMNRRKGTHRVQHISRLCAFIMIATLACLDAKAQTAASSASALTDNKPKADKVEVKKDAGPAPKTSAPQAPKQLKIGIRELGFGAMTVAAIALGHFLSL